MSTSPTDPIFQKKPKNPYNRQYKPTKGGAVLATVIKENGNGSERKIICEQFPMDDAHPCYRPLIFSPNLQNSVYASPRKESNTQSVRSPCASPGVRKKSKTTGERSPYRTRKRSRDESTSPFRTPQGGKKLPFTVVTPDNQTVMKTARYVDISVSDGSNKPPVQKTLFFYSPVRPKRSSNVQHKPKGKSAAKVGTKIKLPIDDREQEPIQTRTRKSPYDREGLPSQKNVFKGGRKTVIVPCKRLRTESSSQRTVMGKSASQDILDALEQNKQKYDPDTFKLLTTLATHFSMEWLHCLAFSLTPKQMNPQKPENLGSGPSWINSYMMVLERVALFFATQHPGAVSVKPTFKMLGETNIIDELEYEVTIQTQEKEITLKQKIKALVLPHKSNWPSCSDSVFTQLVVESEFSPQPNTVKTVFPVRARL